MAKREILIVDDNPSMASLLSDMLDEFHLTSRVTTDGETALSMLDLEEFALVITDLKMPGMSGTELLSAIRSKSPNLPVIVISGYNVATADVELVDGLASGFIQKPFKMVDIQSVIEKHL